MPHSKVGDVNLHYQLTDFTTPWKLGNAPVVLLHGLGGDTGMWFYQTPALCRRFSTLAVDLRGHGGSSRPDGEWSIAAMARDVARLLRNLGAEKAHLVGLSMGGAVAQQFALDYPYAVASLVLANTFCGLANGSQGAVDEALRFIEGNSMQAVATRRITDAFSDAVDPELRDHVVGRVARCDKASYVRAARALGAFSVRDRLGEISTPTLVLVGALDRVTPPALSEEIANRVTGARLVRIAGAGHISNLERPDEFNHALLEFLP